MLLTAAGSLVAAVNVIPLPATVAPVRMGFVVLALAAGIGLTVMLDRPAARPYWQMALASTLILTPIAALQASASRTPFVAIGRGSAGPLLWLTFAVCVTLFALWLFAAYQTDDAPEDAALLFLPAALMVPAILGAPRPLDETAALVMIGEASLVAGLVMLFGFLSPVRWRPGAAAIAIGAQFVLLWTLGRGPVLSPEGGFVVPASAVLLLAVTVLLTVLAPLAALFNRRFLQTVEEEAGGPKPASAPEKGARRRISS